MKERCSEQKDMQITSSDSWYYSADRSIKRELQNFDNLGGADISSGAGARPVMT